MHCLSNNVFANFQPDLQISVDCQVKCILVGYPGAGKTLLFNKLCNVNRQVGISCETLTKSISQQNCKEIGLEELVLYDTPGLSQNSKKQVDLSSGTHGSLQKLLNQGQDLIAVMVKLDCRFQDHTFSQFKRLIRVIMMLSNSPFNLLVMVSYLDIVEEEAKERVICQIAESLQRLKVRYRLIVYSNIKSDLQIIAKVLYWCSLKKQQISIAKKLKLFEHQDGDSQPRLKNQELQKMQKVQKNSSYVKKIWYILCFVLFILFKITQKLVLTNLQKNKLVQRLLSPIVYTLLKKRKLNFMARHWRYWSALFQLHSI